MIMNKNATLAARECSPKKIGFGACACACGGWSERARAWTIVADGSGHAPGLLEPISPRPEGRYIWNEALVPLSRKKQKLHVQSARRQRARCPVFLSPCVAGVLARAHRERATRAQGAGGAPAHGIWRPRQCVHGVLSEQRAVLGESWRVQKEAPTLPALAQQPAACCRRRHGPPAAGTSGAFVPPRHAGPCSPLCAAGLAILLCFPPDGLEWSAWQTIVNVTELPGVPKGGQVTYPSLMSPDGPDDEVLGGTFAVSFQCTGQQS